MAHDGSPMDGGDAEQKGQYGALPCASVGLEGVGRRKGQSEAAGKITGLRL